MVTKNNSFKIVVFLTSVLAFSGCNKGSKLQELPQVEYADFSDLPMSSSPEQKEPDPNVPPKPDVKPEEKPPVPPTESSTKPVPESPPLKPSIGIGSIYYLPVYGEKRNCEKEEQALIKDENEKTLTRLCKFEVSNCAMQGSCFYVDESGVTLYAYKKMVKVKVPGTGSSTEIEVTQPRFRINKEVSLCPQGMGAHKICLDPYRSVAADPKFHKIGDVVFMPILRGKKLPNSEIHDGYMIVRDTGGAIKGEGRFDFFIGFDDYHGHLFSDLKLADKNTSRFTYYRVTEDIAQKVKQLRRFPLAPVKVHETAFSNMVNILGITKPLALADMNNDLEFYKQKWK